MNYESLVSTENLFASYDEFKRGKRGKEDVMNFERNLEENIFNLHHELSTKTYRHGEYHTFNIWDPKHRTISKAYVKDRVVHHMLFNYLYSLFDKTFIFHTYSSRIGKGTHIAVKNLHQAMRKASKNYTQTCYALKCDIRKFFASINHRTLFDLIAQRVSDPNILELTLKIITSYNNSPGTGIPLGNDTSQIFANVYLNELDRFIKHKLHLRYYFRYADDFVLLHQNETLLKSLIPHIKSLLKNRLQIDLYPQKISIRKIRQGVDFLGYVCAPHFRVVRTTSKKRMFRNIKERLQEALAGNRTAKSFHQTIQSYMGIMIHANSAKLMEKMNIPLLLSITEQDI